MGVIKEHKKRKTNDRLVAVEISRSNLTLVVAERADDTLINVAAHHTAWLQEAQSFHSEAGLQELTAAITSLVTREKLSGLPAHVLLGSDLCVTRVASGENERLASEVHHLRERSDKYVLLGVGPKSVAESAKAIDAKHSQAWLTITNRQTLDHVISAISKAGLHAEVVEHTLVALCRAVGRLGHDRDRPVIIADLNERGVDLGVSFRGQLLFDYRPGGLDVKEHIRETLERHLERMQRYCNRQFRNVSGTISDVYLCGPTGDLESALRQFAGSTLKAASLAAGSICRECQFDESVTNATYYVAPLGSLLIADSQLQQPPAERGLPNLMDTHRSHWKAPLWPTLAQVAWPIAAALLVSVGLQGLAAYQSTRAANLQGQQTVVETEAHGASAMRMEMDAAVRKIRYLKQIQTAAHNRAYHKLIAAIGQSLPQGVWLESVKVEADGTVTIAGPSQTRDGIFEFVAELKKLPLLSEVSLVGQEDKDSKTGPVIVFDIKCRFVEPNGLVERTASNG